MGHLFLFDNFLRISLPDHQQTFHLLLLQNTNVNYILLFQGEEADGLEVRSV